MCGILVSKTAAQNLHFIKTRIYFAIIYLQSCGKISTPHAKCFNVIYLHSSNIKGM